MKVSPRVLAFLLVVAFLLAIGLNVYFVQTRDTVSLQNRVAVPYDTDDLKQSCVNAADAGRRGSPRCYDDIHSVYRTTEFEEIQFTSEGDGR